MRIGIALVPDIGTQEHDGHCTTSPGLIHCQIIVKRDGRQVRCGKVLPGQDEDLWRAAQMRPAADA
jgi:hypothetical protein